MEPWPGGALEGARRVLRPSGCPGPVWRHRPREPLQPISEPRGTLFSPCRAPRRGVQAPPPPLPSIPASRPTALPNVPRQRAGPVFSTHCIGHGREAASPSPEPLPKCQSLSGARGHPSLPQAPPPHHMTSVPHLCGVGDHRKQNAGSIRPSPQPISSQDLAWEKVGRGSVGFRGGGAVCRGHAPVLAPGSAGCRAWGEWSRVMASPRETGEPCGRGLLEVMGALGLSEEAPPRGSSQSSCGRSQCPPQSITPDHNYSLLALG